MKTSREQVNDYAAGLVVREHGGDSVFHWWCVTPKEGGPPTYVTQGPGSITVTGDLAAMVFERPGGLPLGFIRRDLETGVTAKCTAGDVWEYSASKARDDLDVAVEEHVRECDDLDDEAWDDHTELDFDDERAVHEWYRDHIDEGGDHPHLGRVLTHEFIRACACIEAAYRFGGEG